MTRVHQKHEEIFQEGSAAMPLTLSMMGLSQQLYILGCPWLSVLGLLIYISALLRVGTAHTKQREQLISQVCQQRKKKKSPSIPSDPLEFLSSLHLQKNKKNLNYNYFFNAYHCFPLLKSTKNESVLDTKNEQTPIPLKRDRQIHKTYWWHDFPSNLLAE